MSGASWVPVAALAAVAVGALAALRGPYVRRVDIPVEDWRPISTTPIVQIRDLHIGPTMRLAYVQRVVDMTKELAPDLIALTATSWTIVPRLAPHVAPLEALASGDGRSRARQSRLLLGSGAVDGALQARISRAPQRPRHHRAWRGPPPDRRRHRFRRANVRFRRAAASDSRRRRPRPAFRLLLAHNPKIAPWPAGRFRPATVGTHARRPVLPVDVRDSPGPGRTRPGSRAAAACGSTQCRHRTWGPPCALARGRAHPPAPRGRERSARNLFEDDTAMRVDMFP